MGAILTILSIIGFAATAVFVVYHFYALFKMIGNEKRRPEFNEKDNSVLYVLGWLVFQWLFTIFALWSQKHIDNKTCKVYTVLSLASAVPFLLVFILGFLFGTPS